MEQIPVISLNLSGLESNPGFKPVSYTHLATIPQLLLRPLRSTVRTKLPFIHCTAGTSPAVLTGRGAPHSGQNLPVETAPQLQVQESPPAAGRIFG